MKTLVALVVGVACHIRKRRRCLRRDGRDGSSSHFDQSGHDVLRWIRATW
jgi:hypothetical protein